MAEENINNTGEEAKENTTPENTQAAENQEVEAPKEAAEAPAEKAVEAVEAEVAEVKAEATEVVEEVIDPNKKQAPKAVAPPEDFDWDAFEEGVQTYSNEERERMDAMYGSTLNSISENEVIMGKVVGLTKKEVVVNIGYKSEGVIQLNEFRYNPDLKVDDEVKVFVESTEDRNGQLVLSHKMARVFGAWTAVNEAMEKDEIITGFVKCRTKGGLIADVFGLEAFLPGSQIDVKPIRKSIKT